MNELATAAAPDGFPTPCRLGFLEYDNTRYCFEHFGFTSCGDPCGRCSKAAELIAAWLTTRGAS